MAIERHATACESAHRDAAYADKHPNVGRAWSNLGYASLAGDRPEEAVAAYQKYGVL